MFWIVSAAIPGVLLLGARISREDAWATAGLVAERSHIDQQTDRNRVAQLESFSHLHCHSHRHDVAPLLGKQRRLPLVSPTRAVTGIIPQP